MDIEGILAERTRKLMDQIHQDVENVLAELENEEGRLAVACFLENMEAQASTFVHRMAHRAKAQRQEQRKKTSSQGGLPEWLAARTGG